MSYYLELQVRGARPTELELPAQPATVGSGASDLRVPDNAGLLERHLLVTPSEAGVTVAVAQGAPGLVFRGQELREVVVPWGEEAYVENVRLAFLKRSADAKRTSAWLMLAPLLLLALGLAGPKREAPIELSKNLEAPELVGPLPACRETEQAAAAARGRELVRAAEAKMQRSVFVSRERVEAIDLLAEAKGCLELAQLDSEAQRAEATLRQWTERLNEDFAAAELRLRLALTEERTDQALSAIRELRALLAASPPSPYAEWLEELKRRLEQEAPEE